jgi:hypothetical protein
MVALRKLYVSEQLLDGSNIVAILQEVSGKRVAEGMARGELGQSSLAHRLFHCPLDDRFV